MIIHSTLLYNIIHTRLIPITCSEFYANDNQRDHGLDNGSRPRQRTIDLEATAQNLRKVSPVFEINSSSLALFGAVL